MKYRVGSELGWSSGRTENISKSGVLVRTGRALGLETAITMVLQLPPAGKGEAPASMACRGMIVRAVDLPEAGADQVFAVRILNYRLLSPRASDGKMEGRMMPS